MIKVALTGSIGMGKSTVADMFERAGVPVFDADREVRRLQGPGGSLVEAIGALFPGTVNGGELDRESLAQTVLADPDKLAALERLVHPAVRDARQAFLARHRDASERRGGRGLAVRGNLRAPSGRDGSMRQSSRTPQNKIRLNV